MDDLNNYQQLNPLQRGKLFKRIKEDQNLSYKEMAQEIKKSPSFIANSVRLLDLPVAIKDGLLGGVISEGHARALASLDDLNNIISVYKEVLKSHATVRETEELVRDKKKELKNKTEINQDQADKIKKSLQKILDIKIKKMEVKNSSQKISLDVFPKY